MNTSVLRPVDLSQDVLESLPAALFCFDAADGTLLALNAQARQLAALTDEPGGNHVPVEAASVFPQLRGFVWGGVAPPATCMATTTDTLAATPQHFELTFHALAGGHPRQWIVNALPTVPAGAPDETSLRDALDDAFHDPLTRLPNRRLFQRRLERAIERAARSDYLFAVLFVDLDRFKTINDRFGHLMGDHLLLAAAHRLVAAVRPQDMVARRDGDEFTILLDDLDTAADAEQVAERIAEHLRPPLLIAGDEVTIGASIGIATSTGGPQTADDLIAASDAAMYHAKALGGGTHIALPKALPR